MSESVNRPFLPGKEVFSNNHLANGFEKTSSERKGGINWYFCSGLSAECCLYVIFFFKEKIEMEDTEIGEKSLSRREFLAGTAAVLAGGSLLAACGSTTSTGGSASTPGATPTNYTFVLIQGVKGDYASGPVTFPLSYIGSDNVQGGKIAGEALIKAIGNKGGIFIENVKPGISTTDQRQQGCIEAIQATNGAVTLVGYNYNGDSSAVASQQVSALLASSKGAQVSGIFGTNLFSAEGSAQAVKNANKQGQIKIANFDAPQQAINDLNNGAVDLGIAQKPADMGTTAVQYGVYALTGKTSSILKRVPTGYVVIDKTNVNDPASQAAIYKS